MKEGEDEEDAPSIRETANITAAFRNGVRHKTILHSWCMASSKKISEASGGGGGGGGVGPLGKTHARWPKSDQRLKK